MSHADRFLELMLNAGVLRFGSFVTKSGRQSPYFFNSGLFNSGALINEVGAIYAATLHEHFPDCTNVYGPAYKGIPLAVAVAMHSQQKWQKDITFTFNRKESKEHGEGGHLVGWQYQGSEKVIIIEDVLTAGTSIRESMQLLKQYGVTPQGVILGVDRQERGTGPSPARDQLEDEYGIKVRAILNMDAIVAHLYQRIVANKIWIDDTTMARIQSYRASF